MPTNRNAQALFPSAAQGQGTKEDAAKVPAESLDAFPGAYRLSEGPAPKLIVSSRKFVQDFVPPDYLIDGIMQRRFVYAFTAPTGAGKTAIALRLAAHVALGRTLGDLPVEKGRVLYFAGENPDDLRMRWMALAEHMKFNINTIDVHFRVGTSPKISEMTERIAREVKYLKGVSLVIVDTSAAYFEGDEENSNSQLGDHARLLRTLTTLPEGPTVLILCHPIKNAKSDNILPRGGGAFLAEVDGNFVSRKDDTLVDFHWQGKFRGAEFDPIAFKLLHPVYAEGLKDSKMRPIPTVLAMPLSDEELAVHQAGQKQEELTLLARMLEHPGLSLAKLAQLLKQKKKRIQTVMSKLAKAKLVVMEGGHYVLTKNGEQVAKAKDDEKSLAA